MNTNQERKDETMTSELYQLRRGTTLRCKAGKVKVIDFIGQGAQGEVYRVELNGRQYALKYYFNDPRICNRTFKENLTYIIDNPVESKSFVWPLHLVENGERFGYIMELLPSGYYDVNEWIGGQFNTTSDVLIKACIALSDGFRELHALEYSYKDISSANIFFHAGRGDVRIVDNDNVTPNLKSSGIKGTGDFMAPELIFKEKCMPARLTDLHSLAVLLFYMLFAQHPLHGKKEYHMSVGLMEPDEVARKLYGIDTACFIFADKQDLNRYIETSDTHQIEARESWKNCPDFIQNLFTQAFVSGIKNPHARPLDSEWTDAFIKLLGLLYRCPHCDCTHMYNRDVFFKAGGSPCCSHCGRTTLVPRMKIGSNIVLMPDKSVLYACYFNSNAKELFAPVLEVEVSRGRLRLKNVSGHVVEWHSAIVGKGKYTDYITSRDEIAVDGMKCDISLL